MKTALALLAGLSVILPQTASAQLKGSPYVAVDAGVSFLESTVLHADSPLGSVSSRVEFDPGYRMGLRLGYFVPEGAALQVRDSEFVCNFAIELDTGLIGNSVANTRPGHTIDFLQVPLVVNVIVIFPVTERFSFSLGLGAGGAVTQARLSDPATESTSTGVGFAYQGLGTISYQLSSHLSLSAFGKVMGSPTTSFPEEPFQAAGLTSVRMDGPLSIAGGIGLTYLF